LVHKLQTHPEDLWQIHHIGIVQEFQYLSDALGVGVGSLLHKSLGSFTEFFLGTIDTVLIGCLDKGYENLRVDLNKTGIDELQKALQDLWLNIRDGNLFLGSFNKWPVEHLLKNLA
jgi:hypothetical protein